MNTDKLEELFSRRFNELWNSDFDGGEFWVNYCDKYEILMLHPDWLRETLNEGLKDRICIHNPEQSYWDTSSPWLLVPRKFAERVLILGCLP